MQVWNTNAFETALNNQHALLKNEWWEGKAGSVWEWVAEGGELNEKSEEGKI
jgi:hypothetical protein